MKNLDLFFRICKKQLDAIKIPYGNIVEVSVNKRFRSTWGRCHRLADGSGFRIEISGRLLENDVPEESLMQTLIHEIIHTCPNCMNHGAMWKYYADKINQAYGYRVKRTNAPEELEVKARDVDYPYQFQCVRCGQVVKRQKMSKFVKYYKRYRCGKCGGGFKKI
ncbi:MAG: SprT-like domain-containing protein [Lachnospiraceae bacterium]|nr:SprT-like domain-containing protein [Lachnospiraceae bacterium]